MWAPHNRPSAHRGCGRLRDRMRVHTVSSRRLWTPPPPSRRLMSIGAQGCHYLARAPEQIYLLRNRPSHYVGWPIASVRSRHFRGLLSRLRPTDHHAEFVGCLVRHKDLLTISYEYVTDSTMRRRV